MTKRLLILFICSAFLHVGTTFIIKEGNAEVGRYEEPDGKNDIQEISGDMPKPAEVKTDAVRTETEQPLSDKNETWTIQGRVLDFLSAKPLTQGKVRFLSPDGNAEIKVNWNGMFSGKIPRLDHGKSYQFIFEPPSGYTGQFLIYHSGQLAKFSPEQRLASAQGMGKQPLVHINNHYVDLEVVVLPAKGIKQKR